MSKGALTAALLLVACGGEGDPPAALVQACQPGEVALATGACRPAGIPPELCADGFTPDGAGDCLPVLPGEPCPSGLIAVPGDAHCRELAPCGTEPWGDELPAGPIVYVDGSFRGAGTGTAAEPYADLGVALENAAAGSTVAIAAGSYQGPFLVDRPLALVGRCPSLVRLRGALGEFRILQVTAAGSTLRGLSLEGPGIGVQANSTELVVEDCWIHDTGLSGFDATDSPAPVTATLRNVLIERAHKAGVHVSGSRVTVERSTIRDTLPGSYGIAPPTGLGVLSQFSPLSGGPGEVTVTGSLVERNLDVGVLALAGVVTLIGTVVRNTSAGSEGPGSGMTAYALPESPGRAFVTGSRFERNAGVGVLVNGAGSEVELEATSVVENGPSPSSGGVFAQTTGGSPALVTVRRSLVAANGRFGIGLLGAEATIEETLIEDTLPEADGDFGRGIAAQEWLGVSGVLTVRASRVLRSSEHGISVASSQALIEGTLVAETRSRPTDGAFGDGIAAALLDVAGSATKVTVRGSRITTSDRAGAAVFGSELELAGATFDCNAFDLAIEQDYTLSVGGRPLHVPAAIVDLGGNLCGCGSGAGCTAQSLGLAPPSAL